MIKVQQPIRRVLSIDGGGIRGIIPALVIAHLERKTGKPAGELFDLIVGTSTGGILALGLAQMKGQPLLAASAWWRFMSVMATRYLSSRCGVNCELLEVSLRRRIPTKPLRQCSSTTLQTESCLSVGCLPWSQAMT